MIDELLVDGTVEELVLSLDDEELELDETVDEIILSTEVGQ